MKYKNCNIASILDNAAIHKEIQPLNISLFLFPNTTGVFQSLDNGIIRSL